VEIINGGRIFIIEYPGNNQMEEPYVSREDFVLEEESRYKTTRRHVTDYGVRNDTDCEPVVLHICFKRGKPISTKREYTEIMRDYPRDYKHQATSVERQTRYRSDQNARYSKRYTEVTERAEQMPHKVRSEQPTYAQDDEKEVDNVENKGGRLSVANVNIMFVRCSHSRVHPCCC